MIQFTLNDFYDRIDYLTEKGTLAEMLNFLELEQVKSSKGNGNRVIYNISNTNFKAFEVLLNESKVIFQVFSPKEDKQEKVMDLFVILFQKHLELLKRLCELLSSEYSHLGLLIFEEQSINDTFAFVVKQGCGGYYITHNPKDF